MLEICHFQTFRHYSYICTSPCCEQPRRLSPEGVTGQVISKSLHMVWFVILRCTQH